MKAKSKSKSNSKQVSSHKDTNHKTSNKKKKTKINKAPPEDYIILNGNIYGANTHSERDKYSGFISNSKVA